MMDRPAIRWVQFSAGDWLNGVTVDKLTLEQIGAYIQLCALMYVKGGPIDDDPRWLSKALRCHGRTWLSIRRRLLELEKLRYIPPRLDGPKCGQLINGRVEKELAKARARFGRARNRANLRLIRGGK
jgi:uncharacterized protein YdaU (DUF1376 family)